MIHNPRWPTFPEFVSYLLDAVSQGQILDMHWTPITEFCTPCMFNFNVIAHTETLQVLIVHFSIVFRMIFTYQIVVIQEDQEYIIYKAGLQDILKPQWMNTGKGTTSNQIDVYYSQLTRAQILQLYHIYRYDSSHLQKYLYLLQSMQGARQKPYM